MNQKQSTGMQKLSAKDQLLVGITLFSMFFGAGNLIFPPTLGAGAGTQWMPAFLGFALSAVGLPILCVAAIALSGGVEHLAGRVAPWFATLFTLLAYLSIGPCLAIPRTASTSFEMAVAPFLPAGTSLTLPRVAYSVLFFALALLLALRPSKLVDRLGKRLAPVLLVLIAALFIGCLAKGQTTVGAPTEAYAGLPLLQGFLDGYQTMDAIAALVFGMILALNIRAKGLTEDRAVMASTIKAGGIAAVLFVLVYGSLTYIGVAASASVGVSENGAQLLSAVSQTLFGMAGRIILGIIFFIACLNTCIGLICCCSEYFNRLAPKISYNIWAVLLAVVSAVVSNAGLTTILKVSVPALNFLYPVTIVLIILGFIPAKAQEHPLLYPLTVGAAAVVGLSYALEGFGLKLAVFGWLPWYDLSLGWVLPAAVGLLIGLLYTRRKNA